MAEHYYKSPNGGNILTDSPICTRCEDDSRWAVFQEQGRWYCCDCWDKRATPYRAPDPAGGTIDCHPLPRQAGRLTVMVEQYRPVVS